MPKRLTYKEFLKRLNHSDKYDYTLINEEWFNNNYKNTKTKIPVICKKCKNIYYPTLNDHNMTKGGCTLGCWGNRAKRLTYKEFTKRAQELHPEYKFLITEDWWQENYKSKKKTKIKIFDTINNDYFNMTVEQILFGHKNPKFKSKRQLMSFKEFLQKMISKKLNKKYYILFSKEWWQENYKGIKTKIKIKCKRHKSINYVTVSNFLNENSDNCKYCAYAKISKSYSQWIKEFKEKLPNLKFQNIKDSDFEILFYRQDERKFKIEVECPIHGKFKKSLYQLKQGKGCNACNGRPIAKTLNYKEFLERLNKRSEDKYDFSLMNEEWFKKNYKGSQKTKLEIICKYHGKFKIKYQNFILDKHGCPVCAKESRNKNRKLNFEEVISRLKKINTKLNLNYEYPELTKKWYDENIKNKYSKIKVICPKHGIFYQSIDVALRGHGCPKCKASRGELKIVQFLDKYKINYIYQYQLKNLDKKLKLNRNISFDFYLPDYNLAIEYDGIQHFKPVDFSSKNIEKATQIFKETKKRDFLKNSLCHIYKINLIRIPYHYKDSLEKYLIKILKRENIPGF